MAGAGSSARDAVVVTGAAGFIGRALCPALAASGMRCVGLVRATPVAAANAEGTAASNATVSSGDDDVLRTNVEWRAVGDLASCAEAGLLEALAQAHAVVHLAGRAHVPVAHTSDALAALERDNVDVARRMARLAAQAGVPRFVHVSSVKVNGERTEPGRPFRPDDAPAPEDAYGRSKLAGERAVTDALAGSATALAILRLPLLYGRDAPANFARLVQAVASGVPLPLAWVHNRRSVLGLRNFAEAVAAVLRAPSLVGTYFVADAESVSSPQLVRAIARALGRPPRLVPLPVGLLRLGARLTGRTAAIQRLTASLEVDTTSLQHATTWRPRSFHLERGIFD